jgi:hypothetical protein
MKSLKIKSRISKILIILFIILQFSCKNNSGKPESIELIANETRQNTIFHNLMKISLETIPEGSQNDSLAFLILPLQASCPSCRKKTIDSLVKHKSRLAEGHFVILSANGGRKTINSFFLEVDKQLPAIENRLFLDSTNEAFKFDLYTDKPTIYYTHNRKAYKKVAAIPSTVRQDLQEFFSGWRNN